MSNMSLKTKILAMMSFLLCASLVTYLILAVKMFSADKTLYVYESNASLTEALASDLQGLVTGTSKTMHFMSSIPLDPGGTWSESHPARRIFTQEESLIATRFFECDAATGTWLLTTGAEDGSYLDLYKLTAENITVPVDKIAARAECSTKVTSVDPISMSSITIGSSKTIAVIAMEAISTPGRPIRMLVGVVRPERMLLLAPRSSLYHVALTDAEGRILLNSEKTGGSVFDPKELRQFATKRISRGAAEIDSAGGEKWLLAFARAPVGKGFMVFLGIGKSRAFLTVYRLIERSAVFALLILSLSFILALFFSRKLTAALGRLFDASRRIASGDLDIEVSVDTKDEVGALADSFNRMVTDIKFLLSQTAIKAKTDQELETARIVQSAFLPKETTEGQSLRVNHFYRSATECGGDWWAHFKLDDGRDFICLADAMGHGVPAALVTAMAYSAFTLLSSLIKTGVMSDAPPSVLLSHFNKILWDAVKGSFSMTMVVAVIDNQRNEIVCSNAGQTFPIFIPKNGDAAAIVQALKLVKGQTFAMARLPSTPLGMDAESKFVDKTYPIEPGDRIFLYTDGLVECTSATGEAWGKNRLYSSLNELKDESSADIKKMIVARAYMHFGDTPMIDDITLLVAEVLAPGAARVIAPNEATFDAPSEPSKRTLNEPMLLNGDSAAPAVEAEVVAEELPQAAPTAATEPAEKSPTFSIDFEDKPA